MISERDINIIRGKMLVAKATPKELQEFLKYVNAIEQLLDEEDMNDMFGTEGWRHNIGIED